MDDDLQDPMPRSGQMRFRHFLRSLVPLPLLVRMGPSPLTIDGHKIFYRMGDVKGGIVLSLLVTGEYEPKTVWWIRRLLAPGMTMVDVGANIGYLTLIAARSVGAGGRVYAFEPILSTVGIMRENVDANGYSSIVEIVSSAVADRSGPARIFFANGRQTGQATMVGPRYLGRAVSTADVDAVSLDDFFARHGWPPVHLVKIDVEGAEIAVLRGMRRLSAQNPHLRVLLEVHEGVSAEDLGDALRACGYTRLRMWGDTGVGEIFVERLDDLPRVLAPRRMNKLLCERPKRDRPDPPPEEVGTWPSVVRS